MIRSYMELTQVFVFPTYGGLETLSNIVSCANIGFPFVPVAWIRATFACHKRVIVKENLLLNVRYFLQRLENFQLSKKCLIKDINLVRNTICHDAPMPTAMWDSLVDGTWI